MTRRQGAWTWWIAAVALALPVAGETVKAFEPLGSAVDWSQFRGPERSGISPETGLRRSSDEAAPRVLWRRPLGEGFSAVSVGGERLYTLFAEGDDEFVAAFRAADGGELWRRRVGERFIDEWGNGPRATPTLDGDTLYAFGSGGLLLALAAADGAVRWSFDVTAELGAVARPFSLKGHLPPEEDDLSADFGHCSSPLVEGDLLIVATGAGAGHTVMAFDKASGGVRWTALDHPSGHSSPVALDLGGERQIVQVLPGEVVGLRPADGEVLWRHPWAPFHVSQPVFIAPDRLLLSTGNDVGAALLRVSSGGGAWSVEELWRERRLRNAWSSSIYYQGHLYGFDNATLKCLDAETGELRWAKRGLGRGSLVLADGLLLVLGDKGTLSLAEASPEGYSESGRLEVFASPSWTAPTLSRGRLFLRNHEEMVSLSLGR